MLTLVDSSPSYQDTAKFRGAWQTAIRGLLATGDHYRNQDACRSAGPLYFQALSHYQAGPPDWHLADLSPRNISDRLKKCGDILMARGLSAYRQGELEQAIGHWQDLLVFDRDNSAALQAVNTTRTQLENLNALSPSPSP